MDNLVLLNLREFLREILLSPIASIKFLHAALNTSVVNIQGARSRKKTHFSHLLLPTKLVAWHSGRTSVSKSDWRTFRVLQLMGVWTVGKPSATDQPTRPTQPFVLSGSINEK